MTTPPTEQVQHVREALEYVRANGLKVSLAGVRHSMGGQAFHHNALVLDMTGFRQMSIDAVAKTLTVQSGATWHDIQNYLHPRLAVKAMQSTDIFTVGGSISVNAHGMDHRAGAVANTIRWLRVMLPDGSIRRVSRPEEAELFELVVGGYGLFGVILDAEIDVVDNVLYHSERREISYREFERVFREELLPDESVGLMYGHLSTAPESFLEEMILYLYRDAGVPLPELPPLGEVSQIKLRRFVFNLSKLGGPAMSAKWFAEKYIEPRLEGCTVTRSEGLTEGGACYVSRNEPMHDSVPYLRNSLAGETDILQEYFVPRSQFVKFVDAAREVLSAQRAKVLNASMRVVHREAVALNYAPADMFALVLYLNQRTDAAGTQAMRRLSETLIDVTTSLGGTFFLPYQLHYTPQQLERSYPAVPAVFRAKRRYDPELLLTNTWYEAYANFWPT
ncbi:MAG: FAD-binding oxidoreductase [Chloroflexota bacterium]|nr:FAD-binding oxidoreductase [Chloroflexota bacterium]